MMHVIVLAMLPLFLSTDSVPAAGTTAPGFTLMSQEGKPTSLNQFRGSWVVLYFYPKDFTSGCTIEAHNFQRDQQKYLEKHAVVLGISVDSVDSHKGFCAKEGLSFKLLSDKDKQVSKLYGSLTNLAVIKFSSRNTFIVDPQGKIVKVFTSVDPRKHSDEVLAALAQLQGAPTH
ncbi:MAG TPA: peroxiredoxin [Terriglobales bacterium]|nr:peroxiredoxin [Terriglobales bacterium]